MPAFCGHIGEVAVAVVVIENRLAVAGDQQIFETVVVVVGGRHRDRVHIRIESRLFRHIGKVPVAVVAIEMIVRRRGRLVLQRIGMHRVVERAPVDHVKRLPAGVVVVEPDAARARSLEQRTQLARPKAMRKANSRLVAGVFKADAWNEETPAARLSPALRARKLFARMKSAQKISRNIRFISIASRRIGLRLANGLCAG